MKTTPQPDAAKMTPTPERFERDHWLPLYVDDCKNYTHNEETISEGYHHIDGGRGFYDEARPQSGICFSGVMSKEQADFIATACNAHARLLAENAALVKALKEVTRAYRGLANSELSIDHDHNRTEHRLAIRAYVWEEIDRAEAALALHQSGNGGMQSEHAARTCSLC